MIKTSESKKRYLSSQERFLKPILKQFFKVELPRFFGPILRDKIVDEIMRLIERIKISKEYLEPGQVLWTAIDRNTRPDSPNRKYVPVILTLIDQDDCKKLSEGVSIIEIAESSMARILREALLQGGLLSMRDVGLLTWRQGNTLTKYRRSYEKKHDVVLPFTGTLQDMGSCITHKKVIVEKVVIQKKDPCLVARETNHSQKAVDRYLNDYNRVKQVYAKEQSVEYISNVTRIAKHVVIQYIDIIKSEN
jgi:hypothetical protein